ncbi:MAG: hypothetical protein ACRDH0_10615 [Actinomycetota bacterium]
MALAHLPIHPDVVSLTAFLLGVLAACLLASGRGIPRAARLDPRRGRRRDRPPPGARRSRRRPGWGVLDRLADAAIVGGLALWPLEAGSDPGLVAALAVAAMAGAMLSIATKDRIAALGIPPVSERRVGFLFGGRDARLLIVAIGAMLGWAAATLVVLIATSAHSLAVRLRLARSTLRGAWPGPR